MSDFTQNDAQEATHDQAEPQAITFTGKADDIIGLCFRNAILNVLSLSLYRFWGRTHVRQYIWSHIEIDGDPLEYTGTGMELFEGFIRALFLLFLPMGLFFFGAFYLLETSPGAGFFALMCAYIVNLIFLMYGLFGAQRYRMSRTIWRGIRGAQVGDPIKFTFSMLPAILLLVCTFGLAFPYFDNQLHKGLTNARRLGDGAFAYNENAAGLWRGFFLSFLAFLTGMIISALIFFVVVAFAGGGMMASPAASFTLSLILYGLFGFIFAMTQSVYMAAKMNYWLNNTKFNGVGFSFSVDAKSIVGLTVTNILIILCSVGVLLPVTQLRTTRFYLERLSLSERVDDASLAQTSETGPTTGEGIAEGFDMGTL